MNIAFHFIYQIAVLSILIFLEIIRGKKKFWCFLDEFPHDPLGVYILVGSWWPHLIIEHVL